MKDQQVFKACDGSFRTAAEASRASAVALAACFTRAGELLCSACFASANIVELESRGAVVQRRGRVLFGVAIALLILVSSLMFAAGLGKVMAEALIGPGILIALAPIADRVWVVVFIYSRV